MSNENKPKRDEAHLYAKLPRQKLVAFDVEVARRQIKRPQALAEAVELWLKDGEQIKSIDSHAQPGYYSERVDKAIQKASDAISLIEESITLLSARKEVKREDGHEQAALDKAIDDAMQKAQHVLRESDLLKEDLLRSEGERRKRKRSGD